MKRISRLFCIFLISYSLNGWSQESDSDNDTINTEQENVQEQEQEEVKEQKYVTDKLRLSLYREADSGSGTIRLLISGDIVNVLDRSGPYSKVRTEQDETGWVKNGFLQLQPTSTFQLKEEQNKTATLTKKLERFANTEKLVQGYEDTIEQLNGDIKTQQDEIQTIQNEFQSLNQEKNDLQQKLILQEQQGNISLEDIYNELRQYWYVGALTILLIFLIGFYIGKEMVEAQVRKRFQGVKVW